MLAQIELTRTTQATTIARTFRVTGAQGALLAEAVRLPSGHAHVTAWTAPTGADTDVLTRRATVPLVEAWDRGGDAGLFDAMERLYGALYTEIAQTAGRRSGAPCSTTCGSEGCDKRDVPDTRAACCEGRCAGHGVAAESLAGIVARRIREHGGIRAASRALGVDAAYLVRLRDGEKERPSWDTLAKLGIREATIYAESQR